MITAFVNQTYLTQSCSSSWQIMQVNVSSILSGFTFDVFASSEPILIIHSLGAAAGTFGQESSSTKAEDSVVFFLKLFFNCLKQRPERCTLIHGSLSVAPLKVLALHITVSAKEVIIFTGPENK